MDQVKPGEGERASCRKRTRTSCTGFYEEWVHPGNLDVADEIIAPDCPLYFGGMFMGTGPEAFKQTRRAMMYSAFPGFRWTIEEIIAERLTGRGTHQGEFISVPPTGSRVELSAVAMTHVREGKIAEMRASGHAGPDAADRRRTRAVRGSQPHLADRNKRYTSLFTELLGRGPPGGPYAG